MGDRYFWNENCPNCKCRDTVEVSDMPSSYMFSRRCRKCNWTDGKDYYETSADTIELLTKEEADERGFVWMSGLEAALFKESQSRHLKRR